MLYKLFYRMFPDSEIAKKNWPMDTVRLQLLSRKPWLLTISLKPFMTCQRYVMMDESNNKTNKLCIILIRVFHSCVGDVRTRFLYMPIINIGSAKNLFEALKES